MLRFALFISTCFTFNFKPLFIQHFALYTHSVRFPLTVASALPLISAKNFVKNLMGAGHKLQRIYVWQVVKTIQLSLKLFSFIILKT